MIIIIINMIEHHHQIIVKRHHDSKVLKLIRSEACWAGQMLPEGEPCHFHYPVIIKHEQQLLLILIFVYHHENDHHQNSCCPEMNPVTYNWTWTNYNWIIDSCHCLTDWPFHFERHTERSRDARAGLLDTGRGGAREKSTGRGGAKKRIN